MYLKFTQVLKRSKEEKGFTLVELLVVIAILGVILAVVTPNIIEAFDKSKDQADELTAERLTGQMKQYYALKKVWPTTITQLKTEKIIDALPVSQREVGYFDVDTVNNKVIHVDGTGVTE